MKIVDKHTFFELTKNFAHIPYSQTRGMYEMHALSGEERIKFFVDDTKKIACFGHEKRFLWLKMLWIDGECYAEKTDFDNRKKTQQLINDLRQFYQDFTALGYDMIEPVSNDFYNFNREIALRQAGFLRPVGAFSMPLTKVVDLTRERKYFSNWENNLKKASKYDLKLESVEKPTRKDVEDFINLYAEMLERKSLRAPLSVEQIFALCSSNNFALFFVSENSKRNSAMLIHINEKEKCAGTFYSVSNEEGRKCSAAYFLHNEMFKFLTNTGIEICDLEKLVPSTKSVNSVFEFKNGIDGKFEVLNGEFSWYKRQIYRPMMYFVKKYLMKKREI